MVRSDRGSLGEAEIHSAYRAHGPELYRFALRSLGDRALAEEAVQEVFLRAWRSADRFDPEIASLRTWLFVIARATVIDLDRARASRAAAVTSEVEVPSEEPFARALEAWQVEEALRRISGPHREVLVETYYKERPYAEVATELGIPEGTVKSRTYYALRALRLALEEMGWFDDH